MAEQKYGKYLVKMPRKKSKFPGGWLMSDELVSGCDINIMFNWVAEKPKPNPMHLAMEAHDYPEIIFTLGMDPHNPEYLGGVIEGYIGQDRQLTTKTTALYIPGNAPHGKVSWQDFEKPHMQMAIKFSGDIREKPDAKKKSVAPPDPVGTYAKCAIEKPVREMALPFKTAGRTNPPLTYVSNTLVPGCNVYLEYIWIWEMPTPNPIEMSPTHKYNKVVLNIGSDPQNPADLGAEIEAYLGGEKLVTDVTSTIFIPKGVPYGPIKWTRFTRPHLQIYLTLGSGDLMDALPGVAK